MLENQCRVWGDVLAAVVYAPLMQGRVMSDMNLNGSTIEQTLQILGSFHASMEGNGALQGPLQGPLVKKYKK
jgi:hypothetical protein